MVFIDHIINRLRAWLAAPSRSSLNDKALWDQYVTVGIDKAQEILLRDLPVGIDVSFAMTPSGRGQFNLKSKDLSLDVRFHAMRKTAHVDMLSIDKRGKGLGRIVTRNSIEFFEACNIKEITLFASSQNGGYYWARAGFLPRGIDSLLKDKALKNYVKVKELLTETEQKTVKKLLRFKNKRDIRAITDLRINLALRMTPTFNKHACRTADSDFNEYMKDVRHKSNIPLGSVLLAGTAWDAYLKLTDNAQVSYAKKYLQLKTT